MKKYIVFLLILFNGLTVFAQKKDRPKIGLVLSGGGAKGFAHIGVLKVIEEAGIKVDYIGGTSMGAVVGGLYASGYNASQLDSIFNTTDFDELLSDYIPRETKNFYEKRNDEVYALVLPFNKYKIGIPDALSKGLYNFNLLSRITGNVKHVRDFSKLPIPFLCIGTDIETGEQVVLNKGNLARAMIASSAFPSLFSPVEYDDKFLVDGGVVNNYPIDEIRKLGADIIIGVDVQNDLLDRKGLNDATKILVQITNLHSIDKMKENILKTDIYIRPDIKNYGVMSFDSGKDIIAKGEEAAFSVFERLKQLGAKAGNYKNPKLKNEIDSLQIVNINCNELKNYTKEYIYGKLRFKPGSKITYAQLQTGINNLNATENFSAIDYCFEDNNGGEDLNLILKENPVDTYLKFGLHYDGLYKSAVLVNMTHKKNIFKNDVASLDVILGDNFRYNFDYYIENGYNISLGFKSYLNKFNRNVQGQITNFDFDELGVKTLNVDLFDLTNELYFQTLFAHRFLIGAGIEYKYLNIKSSTLANTDPIIEKSNYTSIFARLNYDSMDDKFFPKKGWRFSGDIHSYLYSSDFTNEFEPFSIAKANFGIAFELFNRATMKFQSEAGFAIGEKSVSFFNFILGGFGYATSNNFSHFYGYDFLSLGGNSYIKSTVNFDYEVFKKHHINFTANYANIGDNIFDTVDWISIPKISGYAIGYGLETVIGPIEIKRSWSPETNSNYTWFSVGFPF
ncbi:patatin-like phospholipase family protein [Flavobacterium seoulense]|nr:patatin-like phospholipase family protein [Flavobacterium seoulense]